MWYYVLCTDYGVQCRVQLVGSLPLQESGGFFFFYKLSSLWPLGPSSQAQFPSAAWGYELATVKLGRTSSTSRQRPYIGQGPTSKGTEKS